MVVILKEQYNQAQLDNLVDWLKSMEIEIHFSEPLNQPTDEPVDTGYLDAWYISGIPADCTEVMDLIIDFGFANSYDELLNARYF